MLVTLRVLELHSQTTSLGFPTFERSRPSDPRCISESKFRRKQASTKMNLPSSQNDSSFAGRWFSKLQSKISSVDINVAWNTMSCCNYLFDDNQAGSTVACATSPNLEPAKHVYDVKDDEFIHLQVVILENDHKIRSENEAESRGQPTSVEKKCPVRPPVMNFFVPLTKKNRPQDDFSAVVVSSPERFMNKRTDYLLKANLRI